MKNRVHIVFAGCVLVFCAAGVFAEDFWRKKLFHEWTAEEAVKLLRDSPWARRLYISSSRPTEEVSASISIGAANCDPDAVDPNGNCMERRLNLPRDPSALPGIPFANPNYSVYLVRWESAAPVEQAFARLAELGERPAVAYFAPPPRLPADRYVITVKALRPPHGTADPLAERADSREKQRVRLKTSRGTFAPLEIERTGVEATAAVHFFFPREQEGKPILGTPHNAAELIFEGQHVTLKCKFSLDGESLR